MDEDSDTERDRLREEQARRAEREAELAEETPAEGERRTHERRADKADYLREKLQEQAESD